MLEKFTVENYKIFREPITLDFSNSHGYKFNESCIKSGLISKMIIYGPNASGKSSLGYALFDIVMVLTDKTRSPKQLDELSFINADGDAKVARFEYCFVKDNSHIRYMYKKTNPGLLVYEELYVDNSKVFSFDFNTHESDFAGLRYINAENLNFDYLENNLSILRYVANNTHQSADSIVKFIMNFASSMLWFRSLQDNSYIGLTTGRENVNSWIAENNLVEDFQDFLKDIAGIDVKLAAADVFSSEAVDEQTGIIPKKILIELHKKTPLIFEQCASSGMKALQLFYYWSKKLDKLSFLFVDEFDAFYHFELSWKIIEFVLGFKDVQVIFTTHNQSLADNGLLRPDCYFVLDKGKIRSFADSTDRELRPGHNLEKMLRNGEFDVK
ncbi:MAG: chromosome segregation protein SMC [Lachnospiraceae bacterium]|nr:chromosome segregation protein SMC [Lachnospiraceae bacterium]